ncbi:MAG: hypothetical protein J6O09_01065 [Lachnospiraceae bacterium]|nr:hypothetical protein [Lachnospiraceae bacterium]
MKDKRIVLLTIFALIMSTVPTFSATVLKEKEEASLFKKDSIYSEIEETTAQAADIKKTDESGFVQNDEAANRFTAVTATKNGNTYTNKWSNYKITFNHATHSANDNYDFSAEGVKYDFAVYFDDYSRMAVYYTRLARDLNIICANFAPKAVPDDVEIAGATYKHVSLDVPYPYGVEKYNYYFRNVDGKLMVIETYHEDKYDICRKYIDKFTKAE